MVLKIPTYDKLVTRENEPPYWSHARRGGSLQVIVGGDSEDRIVFDPAVPGSGRPWPVKGTGRGQGTAMTHPGRVPGGPHPGLATPSSLSIYLPLEPSAASSISETKKLFVFPRWVHATRPENR